MYERNNKDKLILAHQQLLKIQMMLYAFEFHAHPNLQYYPCSVKNR